jgi:hypothetical protein
MSQICTVCRRAAALSRLERPNERFDPKGFQTVFGGWSFRYSSETNNRYCLSGDLSRSASAPDARKIEIDVGFNEG